LGEVLIDSGKPKYRITCHNTTFYATKPTVTELKLNPKFCS